ncbi:MAG: hypothetical protein ACTHU0_25590 [Kofleriaceae bacterium]
MKPLLLFLGFAVAVYLGVIRPRGHVDHYPRRAQMAYFFVSLALAVGVAVAAVIALQDPILCPPGYRDPEAFGTRRLGKPGIRFVCRSEGGHTRDGSAASGLFALLGIAATVFAGTTAAWRRCGPPPPPASQTSLPGSHEVPKDKQARRRARKQEQHRRRQRPPRA